MKQYPALNSNKSEEVVSTIRRIVELRNQDVVNFNNLPQVYLQGRTSTRSVPTSSTDVAATDRLYDWLQDDNYIYQLLTIGGNLRWRRITHASF